MKFIAFFVFVASASATSIFPSTHSNCQPQDVPTIFECGDTDLLNFPNIAGARIVYNGQTVTWFDEEGCQGTRVSVGASNDCFPLFFAPRCVRIVC